MYDDVTQAKALRDAGVPLEKMVSVQVM